MDGFHSTVLRPPQEEASNGALAGEGRGPRGQLRDILNQNAVTGPPGPSDPPRPQSSSFNLRSPTQHPPPPPFSASPSSNANGGHQPPAPRSILNNPFMSPSAAASSLPPPPLAAPSAVLPSGGPSGGPSGLQAPPHSPLHPPPVYYPQDVRPDRESTREKPAAGSFYDPTTDTTKERRVSDNGSWHNTTTQVSTPKVSKAA